MIDIAIIKEKYSRMTDQELIHLSTTEGKDLTTEAITALYQEFQKRDLDMKIFSSLKAQKVEEHKKHLHNIETEKAEETANTFWTYCFDAKSEGKTDEEIFKGLLELGLNSEQAAFVISSLESRAEELGKHYDNEMLKGLAVCVIGLIVTAITYSNALNGGTYVIAWGAIVFGATRFVRGLSKTKKFGKIRKVIEQEKPESIVE